MGGIQYATIASGKALNAINGEESMDAIKAKKAQFSGMSIEATLAMASEKAMNALFAKKYDDFYL